MGVTNSMNRMIGRIGPGLCRISTNGIAIKTNDGYKVYDVKTGSLINCGDFVFDIGDDMFFCFPTNDIKKGDIILSSGKPVCVIEVKDNRIEAFRYEDSSIITIVPENILFFGNVYFYSKIISILGDVSTGITPEKMLPFMIMNESMKGNSNGISQYFPLMMLSGSMPNMFNGFNGMFPNLNKNDTDNATPITDMVTSV